MATSTNAQSRVLEGIVKDASGKPIENVNLVVYPKDKYNILCGAATNKDGFYKINIPNNIKDIDVVLSCLGYQTNSSSITLKDETNKHNFSLQEDAKELNEVVVSKSRPIIKMKGNTIDMRVAGTVLTKTCFFLDDILNKIPLVAGSGLDYEVLGRGKAEIFINGLKATSKEALDRYKAKDIKSIRVDLAPRAEVSADKSVAIYITALDPDDGYTISAYDFSYQTRLSLIHI